MTLQINVDQFNEWKKSGQPPAALDRYDANRAQPADPSKPNRTAGTRFAGLEAGAVRTRGQMNKSEEAWSRVLEEQRLSQVVRRWWYEPLRVRLTDPKAAGERAVWFTPDFLVEMADGVVFVDDVKGGMVNDASIVRIKMAATIFDLWRFRIVTKGPRGAWDIREL